MPQDTIIAGNDLRNVIIDKTELNITDSAQYAIIVDAIKNGETVTFNSADGKSFNIDSFLKVATTIEKKYDQKTFKEKKEQYDEIGNDVAIMLLIGLVMLIEYAIRKKKEYEKDPIAAEASEPWEEIGKYNDNDSDYDIRY
jgi:hypothetical protein